jgi:DNA-binding transcriptional regulator YdaS (Cro superfamily)
MIRKLIIYTRMTSFLQKAIDLVGSQTALAEAIGVHQTTVWFWLHESKQGVPGHHCAAIEAITDGAVTAEQLRPDVFRRVKVKQQRTEERVHG